MRSMATMYKIFAVAWLSLIAVAPARAADCDWGAPANVGQARIRLRNFASDGCLIAPTCGLPLCVRVAALQSPSGEEVSTVLKEISDSLAAELPSDYPGVDKMQARLTTWIRLVRETPAGQLPVAEWQVSGRSVFGGEDQVNFGSAIESRIETLHSTVHAEFVLAATQMRMALLVDQALRALMAPTRNTYVAHLQSLDRRWQSYVRDSRSSYPWEWGLNDWVFHRHRQEDGFEEPRTRQIVFLHPDAAYQYIAIGDDRLSESLTLEVLGFARYKWGKDDRLKGRLSGSAFVGWRGNAKETPFWGLMTHLAHGGSIGVGMRSRESKTEWGVFASGDVGKLFLANGDARAEAIRGELLKRVPIQP